MNEPKNYAWIVDGIVTNTIWLCESNAGEFVNAVCVSDKPVAIGDQYTDGVFTREGVPIPTYDEIAATVASDQSEIEQTTIE